MSFVGSRLGEDLAEAAGDEAFFAGLVHEERQFEAAAAGAGEGGDAGSDGGLYWGLGLFDRPFSPERPGLGALRPRPTADHAARLDLDAYAAVVRRPRTPRTPRIAIVGAGPAGLACARILRDHGVQAVLFDKGRGPARRPPTLPTDCAPLDHAPQPPRTRHQALHA